MGIIVKVLDREIVSVKYDANRLCLMLTLGVHSID